MDLLQFVVIGMIVVIIATITLAVRSYGAFKVREHRAPRRAVPGAGAEEPLFFERVRFPAERAEPDAPQDVPPDAAR
jgi:hypothetical protein